MAQATLDIPELHRVTLVNDEYLSEHGGRLKAGTVVLVDDKTARRWLDRGIAVPASETDKTLREQKLAEMERLKAELEALSADESPAVPVTRPGGVPARERRQG